MPSPFFFGKIISVEKDSLAEEIDLKPGDSIIEVNGKKIRDIIELSFELADEYIEMTVEHADGEREIIEFEKDIDEELGCEFESAVFDGIRRCKNNCYFCFVNMIDPKMRKSLTIKDDDYRMSFLYGNFITLSNLTEKDYQRIEKFHLSPLFVSIHTMDSKLRSEMLRCKTAGKIHEQLNRLENAGADYHTQIVLCRNLNDGQYLQQTLEELINRRPKVLSIAIVPVGITKFRTDSFQLQQFDKYSARVVIKQVESLQNQLRQQSNETFIYLGDEFYLLADEDIPPAEYYDDFPQLDNGIGLTRSFIDDFHTVESLPHYTTKKIIGIVSGTSIAPVLKKLADEIADENVDIKSIPVVNDSFGETVNVSGLLTGKDILQRLSAEKLDCVLIPGSALRIDTFLDDMKLSTLQKFFKSTKIIPISNGVEFRNALSDFENYQVETDSKNYMWQSNAGYVR